MSTPLCAGSSRAHSATKSFEPLAPLDLMVYVIAHHDAGWTEFDRDPVTDAKTGLPYNLIETPAEYITVTSRLSPDFNERQHPFCGLISSMHSWGLYNGRYGLSNHVLIKQFPETERPLAERMLDGELARQKRLKESIGKDPKARRPARRKETVSELQAAAIHRHAGALFQSGPSERARHADLRACAAQRRERHGGDDQAAGSGRLCACRRFRSRRPTPSLLLPGDASPRASMSDERALDRGAQEGADGMGALPARSGLGRDARSAGACYRPYVLSNAATAPKPISSLNSLNL